MVDLAKRYREAQNNVWPLGGVLKSDPDEGKNRIEFGMNTAKAAERARAALRETDIPPDAVYFNVAPLAHIDDLRVLLRAPNGVDIRLELPESIVAGETAVITVTLTNTSNRDLILQHSPAEYQDLFVFGADGIEVWSKLGGSKLIPMIAASTDLLAGKSISFDTRWAAENNDREAVERDKVRYYRMLSRYEHQSRTVRLVPWHTLWTINLIGLPIAWK
ncbi:MAG: BsuPI-related putative proteinase inhibitor [Methylococcales bacterium]